MGLDLRLRGRHDVARRVRQCRFPARADQDLYALPRQRTCRLEANPLTPARDQRRLACKPQFHRPGSVQKSRTRLKQRSRRTCRRTMLGEIPTPDRALCGPSSRGYSNRQKPETTRQVTGSQVFREEIKMSLTRRQALKSAGAVIAASSLAKPAIAAKDPIPVGYLPALTGPSSSTGVCINRGIQFAVQEINAAGGID